MSLKNLAMKIPDRVRSERLMTAADPIANAKASLNDPNMKILSKIWFAYIDPNGSPSDCPICLHNIIGSFRNLKPALKELEISYQKYLHL